MNFRIPILVLPLLGALADAAQVSVVETSANDADGSTIAAVSASGYFEIGTSRTTSTAPSTYTTYRFTHWSLSSNPAASVRDAWGRSLNPLSFTVDAATTATAHYLPASRDTDADGVPDWWEVEHFGNLTNSAASDGDGDGIALLAEFTAGTSPLYGNAGQQGGVATVDSSLVTCNLAGYPTYTLRSIPAGTVNQSAVVPPGTVVTVPDLATNTNFAEWSLDGSRQQDAWGRALSTFSFTMAAANREAVALILVGDTDSDGIPDAFEQRYYGTLSNTASSDTDGDGVNLLAEYSGNTSPIYGNSSQEGGVVTVDSSLVTCNLAGYPTYTLRSDPAGTVNQSAVVAPGTVVTVPDLAANTNFAEWSLDGSRQQDPWGRALSTFSFTMAAADREAVAWMRSGDTDNDGIPDAFEQRYYGTLANQAASDTDGDGITLLAEYGGGSSPIYGNSRREGGVVTADSSLVTCDLQAEIAVFAGPESELADGGSAYIALTGTGTPRSLSFTIRNPGGRPLTGLTITKDGADAGDFNVSVHPVGPVVHNNQTTFTIELMSGSAGLKTAAIHITSNDADESPFDISLNAEVVSGYWAYQLWAEDQGLTGTDAEPDATPWHDGVSNLLKYACAMDGSTADHHALVPETGTGGLPVLTYASQGGAGGLRFEYVRRRGSGLVYTPVVSPTMQSQSWTEVTNLMSVTPLNSGWERVVYQQISNPPVQPALFGRVQILLNDPR